MPLPSFARSTDDRVLAGVCAGIAQALAVDVTLVRLVFALLALAGGAGILLYLALWAYDREERPWWMWLLAVLAGTALLGAVGISDRPLLAALSAAAADVEELHGVRVELSNAGDCPAPEALVLAAREAMTNAAKFAGVDEIDVYAEVTDDAVSVFVHDRGAGFDRAAVPA